MTKIKETGAETAKPEKRIKIVKDGPYLVSGNVPLQEQIIICNERGNAVAWRSGKSFSTDAEYDLCRCGRSHNKPFCDGTHLLINYDGTETASREAFLDQAETFCGPELTLLDALPLCADARFCSLAGGTHELTRHSDGPQARSTAIQQVADCPAGRLVVMDKTGSVIEPEFEASIGVVEDPHLGVSSALWVRGGILIESADGSLYEIRNRVTLCRCGRSENKPFCDSSHERDE